MEVDHDLEVHRVGEHGQGDAACLIVVAHAQNTGGDGGIHKGADADGVDAMIFENLQRVSGCSGGIGPCIPRALQLGQPSDIGSNDGGRCRDGSCGSGRAGRGRTATVVEEESLKHEEENEKGAESAHVCHGGTLNCIAILAVALRACVRRK